ncbi:hypothetical protein TELCIR_20990, partial [Teladorsagia circumcincta]
THYSNIINGPGYSPSIEGKKPYPAKSVAARKWHARQFPCVIYMKGPGTPGCGGCGTYCGCTYGFCGGAKAIGGIAAPPY